MEYLAVFWNVKKDPLEFEREELLSIKMLVAKLFFQS